MTKHNLMSMRDPKSLALHLICEDLKYHHMVAQCAAVEVHIEFFPDMATVVKILLGQEGVKDDWEDRYVTAMGKAEGIEFGDQAEVQQVASKILAALIGH